MRNVVFITSISIHNSVIIAERPVMSPKKEQILRWLAKELRKKGFDVRRDYIIDIAGVTHVVDLLAVLTPVTDVEVKLAFIVDYKELTPEDIERYYVWKQEGGFDKVVVIATGKVDVEAYELAKRFGVDIVRAGRDMEIKYRELGEYIVAHVHPVIAKEKAVEILKKHEKGFFRRKGELIASLLTYIPLIEFEAEAMVKGATEEESVIKVIVLTFDGIRGTLVVEEGGTVKPLKERGSYAEISDPALDVLKILVRDSYKTISELAMELKLSEGKIQSISNFLLGKDLVDIYSDMVELRKTLYERNFSVSKLLAEKGLRMHDGDPPDDKDTLVIFPRVSMERLISFMEALAHKIKSIMLIYYPFYVGFLQDLNDVSTRWLVTIDGITGNESPEMVWLLSQVQDILEDKALKRVASQ